VRRSGRWAGKEGGALRPGHGSGGGGKEDRARRRGCIYRGGAGG
jgi:hypothetical protein